MYKDKNIAIVMPAFNAAKPLGKTYAEVIDQEIVGKIITVDNSSQDETVEIARKLSGTIVHTHSKNLGYGTNHLASIQGG